MAALAVVGIGLLVGGAVGLCLGWSRRNREKNEAQQSVSIDGVASVEASEREQIATGQSSPIMANDWPATGPSMADDVPNAVPARVPGSDTGPEALGLGGSPPSCTASDMECSGSLPTDSLDPTKESVDKAAGSDRTLPSEAMPPAPECDSIVQKVTTMPQLSRLLKAIQASELTDTLADKSASLTVLAPSNSAFSKLSEEELSMLMANQANLTHVLKLHVIRGIAPQDLLKHGNKLSTLAGTYTLSVVEGGRNSRVSAGGTAATVTTPNIQSCKAIIHIIDSLLVAPKMFATADPKVGKAASKPIVPDDTKPTVPDDTKPIASDDTKPTASDDTKPTAPDDTKPTASRAPTPVPATPPGRPNPADGVKPGPDGKWSVCAGSFGKLSGHKPCGVHVSTEGKVSLGEYFGGFDGFFSFRPSDGHENCFNGAVVDMFEQKKCDYTAIPVIDKDGKKTYNIECEEPADGSMCVCMASKGPAIKSQRGTWPGNQGIKQFLKKLRDNAAPVDYAYPEDRAVADGGGREDNKKKVEKAFTDMLNVLDCSQFE